MVKELDILIWFLVQTKKLKFFEAKLKNENIDITDSKLYNKRKSDILYLIKSGKQVKQTTKQKYNIK